ncbi:hypothetical protein EJ03DRAFT_25645 [Teratosphaeria nubilosa]|uniref:Uncharacterized protein n=1 Tax=Teratosphaeria nubilosa TaxID=161662 RepID=A0A6G1KVC1_9PEZI|nr:hypothetical protein EJ03DRAFT_25645 [Teratosphaeria nubilosa]
MPSPSACTPPRRPTTKHAPYFPPSPPLSPTTSPRLSPVDRLLGILRLHRAGKLADSRDWRAFRLSAPEVGEFERRLRADAALTAWSEDKPRCDSDGRTFILRMPSAVHESFIVSLEGAIAGALSAVAGRVEEGAVKDALNGIWLGRSTTLELHAPALEISSQESQEGAVVRRSPDATFWCRDAGVPGVVVEVSYSQQRKDLPRLAESYVVDSRHGIKCVVGLDIPYGGKGDASVSLWRAATEVDEAGEEVGVCRCDVDGAVFRREDGGAGEGELELRVADFVEGDAGEERIRIPFEELSGYLADAVQRSANKMTAKTTAHPKKFRKRKRSPDEDLSLGREEEYARLEATEVEKEQAEDGAWRARSRRRVGVDAAGEEDGQGLVVRRSLGRAVRRMSPGGGGGGEGESLLYVEC